jgi:ubiquinone/menaquinone biosynthesis C-methylase UbiE
VDNDVVDWYSRHYDEAARLPAGSLELIRTREIIGRYLGQPPMTIADVGGATGPYSFWLAEAGHQVHLVDLTPRHIEQAKAHATATGVQLSAAICADARQLPFPSGAFDLVLEMGPLYHLQAPTDRQTVLREAHRVLKPGCPVIAAAISRYASMFDGFQLGLVKDWYFQQIMEQDLATGCHENPQRTDHYFTTAYFHTPDELRAELEAAGFREVTVLTVEGFATLLDHQALLADPATRQPLLDCLRQTEAAPELLGASAHLLAIAHKP